MENGASNGQGNMVGISLMGSEEGDAALAILKESAAKDSLRITDNGPYFKIEAENRIEISMEELSKRLGREIDVPSFLVVLVTYYGRMQIENNKLSIVSELIDL